MLATDTWQNTVLYNICVERMPVDLEVTSVAIDEAKARYIEAKGVSVADVAEVFNNRPRFFTTVSEGRRRPAFIGPTRSGRFLLVPIQQVTGSDYRLITAFWLNQTRGQRIYEELG